MLEVKTVRFLDNLSEQEKRIVPKVLYYEGDLKLLLEGLKVSVVGLRKVSVEGRKRAKAITKALVERNITVVSGLAEGVDTAAHETAIGHGGKTIAVLGTPLSQAFPAKNRLLLQEIQRRHLAVSQFPDKHPVGRKNFPMRNKTMALISDATVIVEASERSGTRHQGWECLRLGRDLFLMKNVVDNPLLTWPAEMLEYGAQVLVKEDLDQVLDNIPNYTAGVEFAY